MKQPKSPVKPHLFVPDPEVPADPRDPDGRGACSTCHLIGEPGDPRHTLPPAGPEQAAHVRRYEGGER